MTNLSILNGTRYEIYTIYIICAQNFIRIFTVTFNLKNFIKGIAYLWKFMLHFVVKSHNLNVFRCKVLVILLKREAGLSPARSRHCNRELYRICHCPTDGKTYKALN